ncbi:MAG TPA: 3-hydroxyacyl-ACP dehydratase FabZ [Vicinamibacteria bacterium]|jgi:3-hydroxyacyl-[acyl-carrier-protein] dehydratase
MADSRVERASWALSPPPGGDRAPGAAGLDFEDVRRILAHRFPMLMVDRVTAFEAGRSLRAIKQVTGNDVFFVGHFPRQAVWPGALIAESMAQASALLFVLSRPPADRKKRALKVLHKMTVTFTHPVFPGDTLVVQSDAVKIIDHGLVARAVVTVDERVVAKGEFILGEISSPARLREL